MHQLYVIHYRFSTVAQNQHKMHGEGMRCHEASPLFIGHCTYWSVQYAVQAAYLPCDFQGSYAEFMNNPYQSYNNDVEGVLEA